MSITYFFVLHHLCKYMLRCYHYILCRVLFGSSGMRHYKYFPSELQSQCQGTRPIAGIMFMRVFHFSS